MWGLNLPCGGSPGDVDYLLHGLTSIISMNINEYNTDIILIGIIYLPLQLTRI